MDLIHTSFRDIVLAEEETWQAVVLIPKGGGDNCGIGIVEVVWKAVVVILNCCFTAFITYHNSLIGFQAGRGTGTATLKVNMLQQIVATREAVIQEIFLGLHKVYNALDRSRCLYILEGCGVGIGVLCLL